MCQKSVEFSSNIRLICRTIAQCANSPACGTIGTKLRKSHPNSMQPLKIEQRLRLAVRERLYSRKTEKSYVMWYKQFVRYHGLRHPNDMGEPEISAFLRHLALEREVAASTHRTSGASRSGSVTPK